MSKDKYAERMLDEMKDAILLEEEDGELYGKIHDIFKDIPDGCVGFFDKNTGEVRNLGSIDQQVANVVYEEGQNDSGSGGTSHIVKYDTLYDLINSEPSINLGLTLHSELPVAYGYRFQMAERIPELEDIEGAKTVSIEFWTEWGKFVNLDHIFKQSIHSLKAMGVLYVEKTYDNTGLTKKGWGIRKMRVLSPDAMYVVVDSKGNIEEFVQWTGDTKRTFHPDEPSVSDRISRNLQRRRILTKDKKTFLRSSPDAIVIPRHKIIFATYNAYYDDTVYGYGTLVPEIPYSKSKIGAQKRVLRIIENLASNFIVFKYGTQEYMVSGKAATSIMNNVAQSKNPRYIVLPFYFDVEAVEMGDNLSSVEPFLNYFRDEQIAGIGIPMILLRPGGSGEGATIQLEAFTRQMKFMQNIISNIFRAQCFPEALMGDPSKSYKLRIDDPRIYPYIKPSIFNKIPELKWNVIESVADRRLRLDVDAKHGAISISEYRNEIGRIGKIADGDMMPTIQLQYDQFKSQEEIQKIQDETARMQMENEKEMAKLEMQKMELEMKKSEVDRKNQARQAKQAGTQPNKRPPTK
jgi:hypothetical protein